MDDLIKLIQEEVSWRTLFADDIVLLDETRSEVNVKLEIWRNALESKGFLLSRTKTKYMECSESQNINKWTVRLDGQEILNSDNFRYLGSVIHKDGEI